MHRAKLLCRAASAWWRSAALCWHCLGFTPHRKALGISSPRDFIFLLGGKKKKKKAMSLSYFPPSPSLPLTTGETGVHARNRKRTHPRLCTGKGDGGKSEEISTQLLLLCIGSVWCSREEYLQDFESEGALPFWQFTFPATFMRFSALRHTVWK